MDIEVCMSNRALYCTPHDIDNTKGDHKGTPNFSATDTASKLRGVQLVTMMP